MANPSNLSNKKTECCSFIKPNYTETCDFADNKEEDF